METLAEQLEALKSQALAELEATSSPDSLESWRIKYLGRKGSLATLTNQIKDLPAADRKSAGQSANSTKKSLEQAYKQANIIEEHPRGAVQRLPGGGGGTGERGHIHPLSQTIRDIQRIFSKLGFTRVEGPLVEDPFFDFDSLNMPPEHPARAETDTFYIKGEPERVMRTSTSAVQVRSVKELNLKPPFKLYSLGRVFRSEKIDPSHSHTFHQLETLVVGKDITIADYLGTTNYFFSQFFQTEVNTRLRPGYFPFVEPGFEPDMQCAFCHGDGCRVCQHTGWIEMGGAGMVHPQVLRNMDIDPQEYQGFAWGYGLERHAMLRHGINDIRLFMSGDLRFLKQF